MPLPYLMVEALTTVVVSCIWNAERLFGFLWVAEEPRRLGSPLAVAAGRELLRPLWWYLLPFAEALHVPQ